jgi:4-hydroxybenzoate polyprenyltransferase
MTALHQVRPWAQLLRLPNVFTVWADVALGVAIIWAAGATPNAWAVLLAAAASTCLYFAGMVLNDVFDLKEDRRDRPQRPLPAGRIPFRQAAAAGASLLLGGVGLAVFAGWFADSWAGVVAGLLAAAILAYDGGLKRTRVGPAIMGSCRFLNVSLATQAADVSLVAGLFPALVIGTYIAGLTWFAREEARQSRHATLAMGLSLLALAWLALGLAPTWMPRGWSAADHGIFILGGLLLLLLAVGPLRVAWGEPAPAHVQAAVKRLLQSYLLLDALLAFACVGSWGLLLLLLLPPMLWLGNWLYST